MGLILDTNFVIALEREARRREPGAAHAFLRAHSSELFHITFTVAGELACGQSAAPLREWKRLCQPYPILPWNLDISWQYGESYRQLQTIGRLIGTNDLWIAATALVNGMAVVTNNQAEFERVAGLTVLSF